jgi:TolB-like protein/class 3 adenylate cyclase/cytochrome c-type biogenesis protein CcmH/NrfG
MRRNAGDPVEQQEPKRKLTTIFHADAAGYSRLMRADEEGTYRRLQVCRQQFDRLIEQHQGRIFGTAGDSVIAEFESPVEAVRAAIEIRNTVESLEAELPEERKMRFRTGINLGDVMVEGNNLFGDGVNVAQRLGGLSEPGGICISSSVFEQVRNKLPLEFEDIGNQLVKNIVEPVRAYRVRVGTVGRGPSRRDKHVGRNRFWVGGTAVFLLTLAAIAAVQFGVWPALFKQQGQNSELPRSDRPTIAVLPFANLTGDPAQDYFSDGVTEDVIAALSRFSDLSVIARAAVLQYKGRPLQPGELSRDLGARHALEGSVDRQANHVRVNAQLIDAVSGVLLGSDSYDGELKDLFAVRDHITQSVVGNLAIRLSELEKRRAFAKPTENLAAYDYVLRGRDSYAQNTRPANNEARAMFEQAIRLDPGYASAYVALGQTWIFAVEGGWTEFPVDALQKATELAQKAIELDDSNSEAHLLLADVYFDRAQFDLAITEVNRALALNPNDAAGYADKGGCLVYMGHSKEAIEFFEIAKRLNPALGSTAQGSGRYEAFGWAYYMERRYDDAISELEGALRTSHGDMFVHAGLAASYAQSDRAEDAAREAAAVTRLWPFFRVDIFSSQFRGEADRLLAVEGLRKAGLK